MGKYLACFVVALCLLAAAYAAYGTTRLADSRSAASATARNVGNSSRSAAQATSVGDAVAAAGSLIANITVPSASRASQPDAAPAAVPAPPPASAATAVPGVALSSITVPSLAANLPGKNYAKYLLDSTGGSGTDANYLNDSYGMLPLDGKMLLGFSQYASQITDGKLVSSKPVYLVWVMASLDKKEASAFDKGKNISFAPYSLSASYSSREDALAQYGIIRNAISDAKRGKQGAGLPSTGASLSFKSHSCFDFKATLGGKDGYAGACDLDMSEGSSDYLGILESVD